MGEPRYSELRFRIQDGGPGSIHDMRLRQVWRKGTPYFTKDPTIISRVQDDSVFTMLPGSVEIKVQKRTSPVTSIPKPADKRLEDMTNDEIAAAIVTPGDIDARRQAVYAEYEANHDRLNARMRRLEEIEGLCGFAVPDGPPPLAIEEDAVTSGAETETPAEETAEEEAPPVPEPVERRKPRGRPRRK